ncbi:MAG: DUF4272 domain-containing protein, partial [Bacteroidota bacterium]
MDLKAIREASWHYVREASLPINPSLPLLDRPAKLRPLGEVVDKGLVISVLLTSAYGFPRTRALDWLVREKAVHALSPIERQFLGFKIQDKSFIYDQVEGLWALSWAMNLLPALDFKTYCNDSLASLYPELNDAGHREKIEQAAAYRPVDQIVSACDLAYCLHWAFVEMRVQVA